jgi:hypothetical protein
MEGSQLTEARNLICINLTFTSAIPAFSRWAALLVFYFLFFVSKTLHQYKMTSETFEIQAEYKKGLFSSDKKKLTGTFVKYEGHPEDNGMYKLDADLFFL